MYIYIYIYLAQYKCDIDGNQTPFDMFGRHCYLMFFSSLIKKKQHVVTICLAKSKLEVVMQR